MDGYTQLPQREQTFGERAVRLDFNASGDSKVNDLKVKAAAFIDVCHELREASDSPEVKRQAAVAITEAESACMWAVKAATAKAVP